LIVIHKLSTIGNKGLDTLWRIRYNDRMIDDPTNDPSAFERLTNDAMDDCDQLEAHEELGDPEYVNWERDYYGNDADDWPF
jgi:hypothetical protein